MWAPGSRDKGRRENAGEEVDRQCGEQECRRSGGLAEVAGERRDTNRAGHAEPGALPDGSEEKARGGGRRERRVAGARCEPRRGERLPDPGGQGEEQERRSRKDEPGPLGKRARGRKGEPVPQVRGREQDPREQPREPDEARRPAARRPQERLDRAADEDLAPEEEEGAAEEMPDRRPAAADAKLLHRARGEEGAQHDPEDLGAKVALRFAGVQAERPRHVHEEAGSAQSRGRRVAEGGQADGHRTEKRPRRREDRGGLRVEEPFRVQPHPPYIRRKRYAASERARAVPAPAFPCSAIHRFSRASKPGPRKTGDRGSTRRGSRSARRTVVGQRRRDVPPLPGILRERDLGGDARRVRRRRAALSCIGCRRKPQVPRGGHPQRARKRYARKQDCEHRQPPAGDDLTRPLIFVVRRQVRLPGHFAEDVELLVPGGNVPFRAVSL